MGKQLLQPVISAEKYSQAYMYAICGASEEKNVLLVDALRRKELPTCGGKTTILEVGPGSGESLRLLHSMIPELSLSDPVQLVSVDLHASGSRINTLRKISVVVEGDVQALPFEPEVFSAVNISAVLHEVYSYGRGLGGIHQALREMSRVLLPGGICCYRDPYAPNVNFMAQASQLYKGPAWISFLKHFVPDFLQHGVTPYATKSRKIRFYQSLDGTEHLQPLNDVDVHLPVRMEAPVGLQREIQRHYLTLREYLIRSGSLGFRMVKPGWKGTLYANRPTGVQTLDDKGLAHELIQAIASGRASGYTFKIHGSLLFDQAVDFMMCDFFDRLDQADPLATRHYAAWQAREGRECYTYLSLSDLLVTTVKESLRQSKGEYVLLPSSVRDIRVVPRYSYQIYLSTVLGVPFFEGKQMVRFTKYKRSQTRPVLQRLLPDLRTLPLLGQQGQHAAASINRLLKG
ncbi:MAG: class I SAM-dependent methyltransferase [Candidatus Gottesmanbacteria bacterium]|nr:class I SAM-dependent methyltransferase [Candidatus Gottesmanbacteria bacterium]